MSVASRLRALSLGVTLMMGSLIGVPMPPDRIEELLRQTARPKVAHSVQDENDEGDELSDDAPD